MSSENQFIYPGPQGDSGDYSSAILVQYGSPQEFNWTTSYNIGLKLVLWQETAETKIETLATNTQATTYYWDGRPSQNLHLSDIFFLTMSNSSNFSQPPLFISRYINVTTGAATPSPTISSSSSSSSSSFSSFTISTSSSSSPVTQPITTPTSAVSTTVPKSKPNHAALGIGLGIGLGGAALLLTAVLLYCLRRERRRKSGRSRPPEVYQLSGDSM